MKYLLVPLLCLAGVLSATAIKVDKESWEEARRGIRYDGVQHEPAPEKAAEPIEDPERDEVEPSRKVPEPEIPKKPDKIETEEDDSEISKYLAIGLLILIAIFLIIVIIRQVDPSSSKRGRKLKKQDEVSEEELTELEEDPDALDQSNLQRLLQAAVQNEDFRMAIRIAFLLILEGLEEQKIIKWEKSKTNRDYYYEAGRSVDQADFRTIISVYEAIWFGREEGSIALLGAFRRLGETFTGKGNG